MLIAAGIVIIAAAAVMAWRYYGWIYDGNTRQAKSNILLIHEGASYQDVVDSLIALDVLINVTSFERVARLMKFGDRSIKEGRYYLPAHMSNRALIQKLRLGQQDAIDLVIHSAHTLAELAGKIAAQIEMDSLTFLSYMRDVYLPASTYTEENILTLFIPNTYEVWWNVSSENLLERMETEHARFWNETRLAAAQELSLKPTEVYTLASIVEAETQAKEERKTIAGVYLNRLRRDIPLQADPTIRFALRDDSVRRILHKHLTIDSPYNTYQNTGLPPGPIAMPTIHSIDAVLYPEDHDYIFFCAKPGYDGRHLFAKTLSAHLENARIYQSWLNEQGIR